MLKIKKHSKKKKFLVLGAVVLLIIGGVAIYALDRRSSPAQTDGGQGVINLDPPTEEDAKRVEDNKNRLVEKQEQEKPPSVSPASNKNSVKPVITYAGQYDQQIEVGAYVPVFEDDGSCTATFTNGAQSFTKVVKAVKNANTTNCPVMAAQSNEFSPKGKWSVMVSYESSSSIGQSEPRTIEVK